MQCKEFLEITSNKMPDELTRAERMATLNHALHCPHCRLVVKLKATCFEVFNPAEAKAMEPQIQADIARLHEDIQDPEARCTELDR